MTDTLHIYGQGIPHDNVYITGDRLSLRKLINCIEYALETGREGMNFYTNDGEGYTTYVYCVKEEVADKIIKLPYYDGPYDRKDVRKYPWQLKDINLDKI